MKIVSALAFTLLLISTEAFGLMPTGAFWRRRILPPSLAFTTSAQTVSAGMCSGVMTVQTRNGAGVATNVASNLTVALAGTGALTFYSDVGCTAVITSVVVAAASNSSSFYFVDSTTGSRTISATATGYSDASQTETISANAFIWTGGGANANWNTALNWSGGVAPINSSIVLFDGTCSSNCSPNMTANVDVGGVRMTAAYAGTVTQNAGFTVAVRGGGWSQQGGTFIGSDSANNITVYGPWTLAGGTFKSTRGTLNFTTQSPRMIVLNSPTFNHNAGTVYFDNCASPYISPGSIVLNHLSIGNGCNWSGSNLAGTLNVSGNLIMNSSSYQGTFGYGGTINLMGNVANTSTTWGLSNNCKLLMAGGIGSAVTVSTVVGSGGGLGGVEIASQGSVTFTGEPRITGDFKYTSGTVDTGTTKFYFGGSDRNQTFTPGSIVFYDAVFNNGAYNYNTLSGTLYVERHLYLSAGDGRSGVWGGPVDVKGNVFSTSNVHNGDVPVRFVGATEQTINFSAGANFYSGNITLNNTAAADLALTSNVTWNATGQALNVISNNVKMAGYSLTVKSLALNGKKIIRSGGVLTVNGAVVGAGTVSAYGGTIDP